MSNPTRSTFSTWRAQTFTPSANHTITKVNLKMRRAGSPGTLTVSIRATSGGLPTGNDLCSGTTDGDTLPTESSEWREITLGVGYALSASTQYAIVIRAVNGDDSNSVSWRQDSSSPTYTGGERVSSDDSGSSWEAPLVGDYDCMFEEWGTVISPFPTHFVT